jgi:hypothetical protein
VRLHVVDVISVSESHFSAKSVNGFHPWVMMSVPHFSPSEEISENRIMVGKGSIFYLVQAFLSVSEGL